MAACPPISQAEKDRRQPHALVKKDEKEIEKVEQ
jgi:hypothetical protein